MKGELTIRLERERTASERAKGLGQTVVIPIASVDQELLSLAHRHAGNDEEADKWLAKARQWLVNTQDAATGELVDVAIVDWLPFHVLLREAEPD